MQRPDNLCMAPWTHTYLSPQTERRMCCASREPAQNFQQYIDTAAGTGRYIPMTLEQHWNGEHMRSVRRRMLAGESLPECEVCDNRLLNTDVYRDYFWHLFQHLWPQVADSTDSTGATSMRPVSWDYRFSNLCNFKCRMCGDMLSSSWESEQRQHDMINWEDPKNSWMKPDIRRQISQFQDQEIEREFSQAVEQHRVQEIYWVGGEPLMYEQHWRYMNRIIELGDGGNLYARYNTNLSRCEYRGQDLWQDILCNIRDWQICASLDGTGPIGEYIRTGLDYQSWLTNFVRGVQHQKHRRQMRIDFTLTLPGLWEVLNVRDLGRFLGVEILAKVVFGFTPDMIWSPLALPRHLLEPHIRRLEQQLDDCALRDIIVNLRNRPTLQEAWPDQYWSGMQQGKARVMRLEQIRQAPVTLEYILGHDPLVLQWWQSIPD